MKHLANHIRESLELENGVKLDVDQLYKLYKGAIDTQDFAVNCGISKDSAKDIKDVIDDKHIFIVSYDEIRDSFDKEIYDDIKKNIQKYVELGVGYGSDLQSREDSKVVKQINDQFFNIELNYIEQYFWKMNGNNYYLCVVVGVTPDVEKIINRL